MIDFRELLECKDTSGIFRINEWINLGDYKLSIQASNSHYCTPRENLIDLFEYESMEVAIFKNGDFINLEKDSFFDKWKDRDLFLENYDTQVAGYVPIDVIQSLFNYMLNRFCKNSKVKGDLRNE